MDLQLPSQSASDRLGYLRWLITFSLREFENQVPTWSAWPSQVSADPVKVTPARAFRNPFAFDDGDIILRSSDSVEFKVHSLLLRLASPTFAALIGTQRNEDYVSVPLRRRVLEALLRYIYPMEEKSQFNSVGNILDVYNGAIDFQVACAKAPLLLGIKDFLSRESNPLRAWAIAEHYDIRESKNEAARQFIQTDEDLLSPAVRELQDIPALRYNLLLTVKRDILLRARAAVLNVIWGCPSCSRPSPKWKAAYLTRVSGQNPFTPEIIQDSTFELCCHTGGCLGCPGTFHSLDAQNARQRLKSNLTSILDGVDMN